MRLARVSSVLRSRWSILCLGVIAVALLSPSFGCGGDKPSKPVVVSMEPATATVQVGHTQQFTASVTGTNDQAITWTVDGGAANGSANASGLYTAPATVPTPATVTVRATSEADPTKSDIAVVTVAPPVTVAVAPAATTVQVSQTQQFTATVTGTTNSAVIWTVDGGFANGVIDALGLYTAPATVPSPALVTVRATSQADTSRSGTATVTVTPLVTVAVSPPTASLQAGQRQQFTATVTGTTNQAVTWTVDGGTANGAITTSGLFLAPDSTASPSTVVVRATSQSDPTKSGTATVAVSPAISVTVSPSTATVLAGLTHQFTATVTGTSNPGVVWSVVGGEEYGTILSSGMYRAPSVVPASKTALVQATSIEFPSKSGSAVVTITGPVAITVEPSSGTVYVGCTQQFSALVTGTDDRRVTWNCSFGVIDSTGLYTAPPTTPRSTNVWVHARSVIDPSKSGTAIFWLPEVLVTVSPETQDIPAGGSQQFTVTVTASTNPEVTWTVDGGFENGTISASGLYVAPLTVPNPPLVKVRATSQADPAKSGVGMPTIKFVGTVPLRFVRVPAGAYAMGDQDNYISCGDEHRVTLTRDFYLGQYEVTNQQYLEVLQWAYDQGYVEAVESGVYDRMEDNAGTMVLLFSFYVSIDPEIGFSDGVFYLRDAGHGINPDHPVKDVTWYGAVAFCDWLSLRDGVARAYSHTDNWICNGGNPYTAVGYRLPTDAEWEYATQYGGERIWPWGGVKEDCTRANYSGCVDWTSRVGSYAAAPIINGKWLYDMGGNISEWCNDAFTCDLGAADAQDPPGPGPWPNIDRVRRGGSYYNLDRELRCAYRARGSAPLSYWGHPRAGFRVARTVAP